MISGLERTGRWMVRLRDRSYRWIDVKEFKSYGFEAMASRDVLLALLDHPSYRDDYASPDGETEAPIHGPYRVEAITGEAFDPVTAAEAVTELKTWLEMYGTVPSDQIEGDFAEVVRLIENGQSRFRLRDLGKQALHEWGWVVGSQGFHEFIIIGPSQEVRVVVAADD